MYTLLCSLAFVGIPQLGSGSLTDLEVHLAGKLGRLAPSPFLPAAGKMSLSSPCQLRLRASSQDPCADDDVAHRCRTGSKDCWACMAVLQAATLPVGALAVTSTGSLLAGLGSQAASVRPILTSSEAAQENASLGTLMSSGDFPSDTL